MTYFVDLFLNMKTANTLPFHQSHGKARRGKKKFYLEVGLGWTRKPQTNVVSKTVLCLARTKAKVFFFLYKKDKKSLSKDKHLNP